MSTTRHLRDPGSARRTRLRALRFAPLIRAGGPVPPATLSLRNRARLLAALWEQSCN